MGELPRSLIMVVPHGDQQPGEPACARKSTLKELLAVPGIWRQVYAALTLSLAAFVAGAVEGWPGSVSLELTDKRNTLFPGMIVTSKEISTIYVYMLLSALIHMMATGLIIDRFGRRAGGWFVNFLAPSGWVFLATTHTMTALYVGAALIGSVAISGETVGVIFISEIANDTIRGPLITLLTFFNCLGIFAAHVLAVEVDFDIFHYICLGFTLAFPFLFWRLPESPAFLMHKSRVEDARKSVAWYHGNDPVMIEAEMKKMGNAKKFNFGECKTLISTLSTRRAAVIVVGLSILTELTGTSLIEVFAGTTISTIHLSPISAKIASLVLASCRFFGGILNVYFVERAGRKSTLKVSLIKMGLSLIVLFVFLVIGNDRPGGHISQNCTTETPQTTVRLASKFHDDYNSTVLHQVPDSDSGFTLAKFYGSLVCLIVYTLSNQMFAGTTEVISGEVLSADTKGAFMAFAGVARIGTLIFCVFVYRYTLFIDQFGAWNFLFNGIFCIQGAYAAYRFIPETQGKTLNEIHAELEKCSGVDNNA